MRPDELHRLHRTPLRDLHRQVLPAGKRPKGDQQGRRNQHRIRRLQPCRIHRDHGRSGDGLEPLSASETMCSVCFTVFSFGGEGAIFRPSDSASDFSHAAICCQVPISDCMAITHRRQIICRAASGVLHARSRDRACRRHVPLRRGEFPAAWISCPDRHFRNSGPIRGSGRQRCVPRSNFP